VTKELDRLIEEAGELAYNTAAAINGGSATLGQTTAVLLQSQISVLVSLLYEDSKIPLFWEDVIKVIKAIAESPESPESPVETS
jgi:hypothetical protein